MTKEEKEFLLKILDNKEAELKYETNQKGCPKTYFKRLKLVENIIKELK
jgi:hypothetical protein